MIRSSLVLGTTALALSTGVASAQTVYVGPGYVAPAYVAPAPVYVAPAPVYVAPAPVYVAPPVVHHYYARPRAAVTVAAPIYDYAPAYSETIIDPDW